MSTHMVFDFDGTMARTFDPSPNRISVTEAYRLAIIRLWGKEGEKAFFEVNGLKNRAPIELIEALKNKGLPIVATLENEAEALVQAKMEILIAEICYKWPLPCKGFPEFCQIMTSRQEGWDFSILSSGHTKFIQATIEAWQGKWPWIPRPRIIISDDEVRNLPLPVGVKTKPSPWLFNLVKEKLGTVAKQRLVYVGDDPLKDGLLAQNAGVPFGWFASSEKSCPAEVRPAITFGDWKKAVPFFLC